MRALDLGADVVLVSSPTSLEAPLGALRLDVRTAQEMHDAVLAQLPGTDVLLMAAAVADFRPAKLAKQKIKKEAGIPEIRLEATPDILRAVAKVKSEKGWPRATVGFAAETQNLIENAHEKLQAKKLDLVVANDICASDAGFGVDTNRITLLFPDGREETLPLMSKEQAAAEIMERVASQLLI